MGQITLIEEQKKRSGRVNVYLDGEFWTGMPEGIMLELALREGLHITPDRQVEIELQIAEEAVMSSALNLLSYRDRSEDEMRSRLLQKGFGTGVVEAVIKKLQEYSYIDDQAFADQAAYQCVIKGKGKIAARDALRKAGIEDEQSELSIAKAYDQVGEVSVAIEWLERKPLPESSADRQKLLRSLASRGFSYDVSREALQEWEAASA